MGTLLRCTVHITAKSTNSCVLLLLSYNTSLSKLPVLNGLFVFALKWKKTKGKAFETHFDLNLKLKAILRTALSSYPMSVDLILHRTEPKSYSVAQFSYWINRALGEI